MEKYINCKDCICDKCPHGLNCKYCREMLKSYLRIPTECNGEERRETCPLSNLSEKCYNRVIELLKKGDKYTIRYYFNPHVGEFYNSYD